MFATVECRDAPGGFRGFVKDIFTLPEITLEQVKIPSGSRFYRVAATDYRGQIPVEETVEKLKRLKKSVIFEVNFPCDERTRELEFEPSKFTAQLIFNSAAEYISQLKLEPLKSSVTVFDPEGYYVKRIRQLAPLFSKIRVYTKSAAAYNKAEDELMEVTPKSLRLRKRILPCCTIKHNQILPLCIRKFSLNNAMHLL